MTKRDKIEKMTFATLVQIVKEGGPSALLGNNWATVVSEGPNGLEATLVPEFVTPSEPLPDGFAPCAAFTGGGAAVFASDHPHVAMHELVGSITDERRDGQYKGVRSAPGSTRYYVYRPGVKKPNVLDVTGMVNFTITFDDDGTMRAIGIGPDRKFQNRVEKPLEE